MMKFLQQVRSKLYQHRAYFEYSGFYDVPLGMLVAHGGRDYFFERLFNEELDDYEDYYSVYDLTGIFCSKGGRFWDQLNESPKKLLCTIQVKEISFDQSKRKWIQASVFKKLQQALNSPQQR